jgi:hypothetical protein
LAGAAARDSVDGNLTNIRDMQMLAFRTLALTAALAALCGSATAQDYPNRPVKIVVPFASGGSGDIFARIVGQHLSDTLKQPFVIENRPGAGSIIGTDAVAKSAPDGYTLLLVSSAHATNESLVPNKPFVLMRDLVAVAPINYFDMALVAPPPMAQGKACEISIFSEPNFGGTNATANEEQPNLGAAGWLNQVASVRVASGTWDFFSDPEFTGETMRLPPGEYADLGPQWSKHSGSFMCVQP